MIDLAVGAKRYDGGSGSAVFTGCIPLKPGQLFETALETVSLWDGTQEIGVTASALWPQHPDGSIKIVQIAATLTLNAGVQKDLTLRLGQPRTLTGPVQPAIDGVWMKNPRLIGCTDAAHLCASRVTPMPLVPIPNANLPASWNTFLTTEWDDAHTEFPSWGRHEASVMGDVLPNPLGGTANYDAGHAMYCKYLTSGELDRLWQAHHVMQYAGGRPTTIKQETWGAPAASAPGYQNQQSAVVFYGEAYGGHAADSLFQTLYEPWTDLPFQPIATTEWNSGVYIDLFTCYCLSGWDQALGTFLQYALQSYAGTATTAFPGPPIARYNYAGRFDYRLFRGLDHLYAMLSPPMALYFSYVYGRKRTVPSPRSNRAAHIQWLIANHCDTYAGTDYSRAYAPTHWGYDLWWGWPGGFGLANDPNIPGFHMFQLACQLFNVATIYQHFSQDSRIAQYVTRSAAALRALTTGPTTMTLNGTRQAYMLPYSEWTINVYDDPGTARSPQGPVAPWSVGTLRLFYVLAHQLTGDTYYRDVADLNATKTAFCLGDGGRAGSAGFKELGECWNQAFHAAAYRAGVPFGEWEIAGSPPPPPPPSGEFMATLNTTITLAQQEHLINYTGMRVRFQRSVDGGVTYTDVQSNTRAIGTTTDQYLVPAGQSGRYRAGAALTDGTNVGTEVFSAPMDVAVFSVLTPQTITLAITA